MQSDWSTF